MQWSSSRSAMLETLECTLGDEAVELFASRALYWPAASTLLIADLHLGKAATFREAGIAVPKGSTESDLARLGVTLSQCGAARLVVLGDFLHGASRNEHWQREWNRWLEQRTSLAVQVIGGNHDRSLSRLELGIEYLGPELEEGRFTLRHAPSARAGSHVLCGHVHPVVRLPGLAGRWPTFVLGKQQTILPAFSEFTGGADVRAMASDLAVCVGGTIARVHAQGRLQCP